MRAVTRLLSSQLSGLILVILFLGTLLTIFGGSHVDRMTQHSVNNFLNPDTLLQIATETSFIAIMAVGVIMVIISGGIDLSVGSIYAFAGVLSAITLRSCTSLPPALQVLIAIGLCCGFGLLAGLLNGVMVSTLGVHPFIITLGTMLILRGIAFVSSGAQSILAPDPLIAMVKWSVGGSKLYPIPLLAMIGVALIGYLYLAKTTYGRRIFAFGGSPEASRYSGLKLGKINAGVYVLSGLTAGFSALLGFGYYGSAASADATGYELQVIAAAVVGGTSLSGGKGNAWGALFGALLIVLIKTSIRILHFDQSYEQIIIGAAIIAAVVIDRANAKAAERRLLKAE